MPIRLDAIRYAEEAKVVTPFEAVIGGTRPVKRISRCDDAALVGETSGRVGVRVEMGVAHAETWIKYGDYGRGNCIR